MKHFLFSLLLVLCIANSLVAQQNISFLGQSDPVICVASVWGWADGTGNEYALLGRCDGLAIHDVTVPTNPVQVALAQDAGSNWHEIKTWSHFAYVTNETGGGFMIVDLSTLPDSVTKVHKWWGVKPNGDTIVFEDAHTVFIDEFGYLYINGGQYGVGGTLIFDLNTDPMNPAIVGEIEQAYVHDCYVRNNIMYTAEIYAGRTRIIDVTDKANPIIIASQQTPWNFTHNTWLSDNSAVLYVTDEVAGSSVTAYDISNPGNITELDRFTGNPGTNSVPHNVHVRNDWLVIAHYRDGVIIADAHRPGNLVKVGSYDTYPQGTGSGFNGCWGVYPYLPSGNILASDILNGLYVLQPTYVQACYLEGNVTHYSTGAPLSGVTVQLTGIAGTSASTNLSGNYATGYVTSGTYTAEFSKSGYYTRTANVTISNGVVTNLNMVLKPTTLALCTVPINLSATNITSSGATLNWSFESANSYTVSVRKQSGGPTTSYSTTNTSISVSNLLSCTGYKFRVQAFCAGGTKPTSPWKNFSTTGCAVKNPVLQMKSGEAMELYVFPNPASSLAYLAFQLHSKANAVCEVYSLTGQLIYSFDLGTVETGVVNQHSINVGGWHAGMYLIRIRSTENELILGKLIVD